MEEKNKQVVFEKLDPNTLSDYHIYCGPRYQEEIDKALMLTGDELIVMGSGRDTGKTALADATIKALKNDASKHVLLIDSLESGWKDKHYDKFVINNYHENLPETPFVKDEVSKYNHHKEQQTRNKNRKERKRKNRHKKRRA